METSPSEYSAPPELAITVSPVATPNVNPRESSRTGPALEATVMMRQVLAPERTKRSDRLDASISTARSMFSEPCTAVLVFPASGTSKVMVVE